MPVQKPDFNLPDEYRQLALDLELPEVEAEGVSPEEARRRSESALLALKAKFKDSDEAPSWIETFFELTDGGWPWRQAAYIAWASTPKGSRHPATQDELARNFLGLTSDRPIATWKRRNPAILEMIALLQSAPLWEHRAEIYEALIKVAVSPEYKGHNDRKLALELLGDYVPAAKLEAYLKRKGNDSDPDVQDEDALASIENAVKQIRGDDVVEDDDASSDD